MLSEFEAKNAIYLQKIRDETDVEVRPFPDEVLKQLRVYSDEVIRELVDTDPLSKKVYESFSAFKKQIKGWAEVSEEIFYNSF